MIDQFKIIAAFLMGVWIIVGLMLCAYIGRLLVS